MIRIAVVGAGHWGPNLIRNFDNKLTSEVAWVVDRDAKRREQMFHCKTPDQAQDHKSARSDSAI